MVSQRNFRLHSQIPLWDKRAQENWKAAGGGISHPTARKNNSAANWPLGLFLYESQPPAEKKQYQDDACSCITTQSPATYQYIAGPYWAYS
ncbi:unnamed protein product [Staurois parvus]|uniref:Uncharacterized protein n=1 Tax=Staurois parvus TaxID=386267 RepID=A0ABN9CMB7_9NEOB|nr:unnamed protein product [Staurois parvus]